MTDEHWLESATGFPAGSVAETGLGPAADVLAARRRFTLTREAVDEVIAFTELLAGRAVPTADREELTDDLIDAFEDSPAATAGYLRPLAGGVRRMAARSPLQRAARRLQALTTTWTIEQRRTADGGALSPVMEVVGRHNPLIRYWAGTGVALVQDALNERVMQHRLVLPLVGAEAEPAASLAERLLAGLDSASAIEVAELAGAQLRLLCIRAWLRDLGDTALERLRAELGRAVASALDVDIVVQQLGFRASMAVAVPAQQRAAA